MTERLKMKILPKCHCSHIDIDPTSISKTVTADIPIVGDARQVFEQMLELLSQESAHQPLDEDPRLVAANSNSGALVSA